MSQALANVDLPDPSMATSPTLRTESSFHNEDEGQSRPAFLLWLVKKNQKADDFGIS